MHKTRLDGTGLWGQLLICTLGQLLLGPGGHASGGRPATERWGRPGSASASGRCGNPSPPQGHALLQGLSGCGPVCCGAEATPAAHLYS